MHSIGKKPHFLEQGALTVLFILQHCETNMSDRREMLLLLGRLLHSLRQIQKSLHVPRLTLN